MHTASLDESDSARAARKAREVLALTRAADDVKGVAFLVRSFAIALAVGSLLVLTVWGRPAGQSAAEFGARCTAIVSIVALAWFVGGRLATFESWARWPVVIALLALQRGNTVIGLLFSIVVLTALFNRRANRLFDEENDARDRIEDWTASRSRVLLICLLLPIAALFGLDASLPW